MGQWSRSEVDGKFVALTADCSTHGCVQLCEDAKAVRVSPMDAAVYFPFYVCACSFSRRCCFLCSYRHDLEGETG